MAKPLPAHPLSFGLFATNRVKWWAVGAIISVLVASVADGFSNVILKYLVDTMTAAVQGTGSFGDVWWWAAAFTIVYTGGGLSWRSSGLNGMRWMTGLKTEAYRTLFAYLSHHSARYFSNRFAGALTSKISNVADGIATIAQTMLWQFLPLVVMLIVSVYAAALSDIRFAAILCVWAAVYLAINGFLVTKKRKAAVAVAENTSKLRGVMVDSASNMSAVQQGAQQEFEITHLQRHIDDFARANIRNWMFSEGILIVGNVLQMVFIGLTLGLAVWLLQHGAITVGDVAMMVGLMIQLIRQIFFIGNQLNQFTDSYGQATEGLKELLLPHEIVDEKDAEPLSLERGAVDFKDVEFSYEKEKVFDRFNLSIPAGQKIGIVGHSGAGKTSLTALLLRQYDIQSGDIRIDGQSIRRVTQKSVRRHIAIVPQDTSLFHRSICDNIRYNQPKATVEEVENAAKLAQAHEFIKALPQGYRTLVGERGVKLSGGQRQRIAIARAILKNSPILVLDEATSALDTESESAIQIGLQELMADKTVIAIAHRLSTLKMMDRIVVLERGKIVEDGTHEQLLEKNGIYARLWKTQVRGFIQE